MTWTDATLRGSGGMYCTKAAPVCGLPTNVASIDSHKDGSVTLNIPKDALGTIVVGPFLDERTPSKRGN